MAAMLDRPITAQLRALLERDPDTAFRESERWLGGADEHAAYQAALALPDVIARYPREGLTLVGVLLDHHSILRNLDAAQVDALNLMLGECVEPLLHTEDSDLRSMARESLGERATYVVRSPLPSTRR